MRRIRSSSSAFTLLELIVVLIILAIVAGLVAPSMRAFAVGQSTNDVAEQLVVLARYARTQSINDGVTYRLNFDSSAGSFWLTQAPAGVYNDVTNEYGKHITVPTGTTMRTDLMAQTDGTYVTFQSTGRSDPAHIWFADKLGKTVEVACMSTTELFRVLSPQEMTR